MTADKKLHSIKIKRVFRYDPNWPKVRLFRVIWQRGTVGDGSGYSAKLAVALRPRLFRMARDWNNWRIVICGVEIHHQKSWGGIHD